MKKLLLLVILIAAPLSAQETYSVDANVNQVATLTDLISFSNTLKCQEKGLSPNCTQAQICVATPPLTSGCTAAQARGSNVRIYPNTLAGRDEYFTFEIAAPRFLDLANSLPTLKRQSTKNAWESSVQATKDSICSQLGLPAGCVP